jgi:hypothetical protein
LNWKSTIVETIDRERQPRGEDLDVGRDRRMISQRIVDVIAAFDGDAMRRRFARAHARLEQKGGGSSAIGEVAGMPAVRRPRCRRAVRSLRDAKTRRARRESQTSSASTRGMGIIARLPAQT